MYLDSRGHPGPSVAKRGHPWPNGAIRGQTGPFGAKRGHPGPTGAIRGQTRPSGAKRGHKEGAPFKKGGVAFSRFFQAMATEFQIRQNFQMLQYNYYVLLQNFQMLQYPFALKVRGFRSFLRWDWESERNALRKNKIDGGQGNEPDSSFFAEKSDSL